PICTNDLSINPLTRISSQESHHRRHILNLTKPSQRTLLHRLLYLFLALPRKEHLRRDWPRRHAVGRDTRSLQLLRHYLYHRLHCGL
ncbi:hypothetical protein PanWU01x14_300690, partial [Parasponia andersonii]